MRTLASLSPTTSAARHSAVIVNTVVGRAVTNVYPREVEDVLLDHPLVREAAVVGLPDPTWVEAVTAVVVLSPGVEPDESVRDELTSHVAQRLAAYKKPRLVVFSETIPKTAVGKLDRKRLRADLESRAVTEA
ncbi:AMP-binding enzyme [Aeromicrobium camelliae]|nr:hypothetical protein [Aeromicrobium camelliae]